MAMQSDWRERCQSETRTWLVTGAAGFIGSHLVEELLTLGQEVRGLDDLSTGSMGNLRDVEQRVGSDAWARFDWIEGDIRSRATCERACAGGPLVLHQAALGSVQRSIRDPKSTLAVNVEGFVSVFEAARKAGSPRIVYASSSSVYGDNTDLPKRESVIGNPLSPYAASKRMGEDWATAAFHAHGQQSVGLRYFNVFGPRQSGRDSYAAVIPRWMDSLIRGESPQIYGDGESSRDFCPVANVVQANVLAALAPPITGGRIYNIALGNRTTLRRLFEIMRTRLTARGVDCGSIEPVFVAPRPGDIRHSLADTGRACRELGFAPDVDFGAGIDLTLDAAGQPVT